MLLLLQALLILHFSRVALPAAVNRQINIVDANPDPYAGPADVLLSFKSKDRLREQRLRGNFSSAGSNYETAGHIVQATSIRICTQASIPDKTMKDHVAVVFYGLQDSMFPSCTSVPNQVKFAENSNALALVIAVEIETFPPNSQSSVQDYHGKIPVVILDKTQSRLLKESLNEARSTGSVVRFQILNSVRQVPVNLRLQVLRPTFLNIGLFVCLILLILFVTGLIFMKIRWRSPAPHELRLRSLAKAALGKMEIRKFAKTDASGKTYAKPKKERRLLCLPARNRYLSMFGSLYSMAPSCGNQERCSICLEEYKVGQELRVLFCAHEFHAKCVDGWLLTNRRCPLCQFDVVFKQYPETGKFFQPKVNRFSPLPVEDCNQQEIPLLPSRENRGDASSSILPSGAPFMQASHESKSQSERKQLYRHTRLDEACYLPPLTLPSTTTVLAQVSCGESGYRRRRDMMWRRFSRRHQRARSLGAQRKRRYHRPRMLPALGFGVRGEQMPPVGTVSGYSSDVSSYPDPDRPSRLDDLESPSHSLPSSSESSDNLAFLPDYCKFNQRGRRFRSAVRPLHRISFEESYHQVC